MFSIKEIRKFSEVALKSVHYNCLIRCILISRGYQPGNTASITANICLLVKNDNKNTGKKSKVCSNSFFISHLAALRSTLGHLQGGSLIHLMLITTIFYIRPKWDQWDSSQKPSNSECNMLSHCDTLPESVLETIVHRLVSSFSRKFRSFSLTLNTLNTLSQCYYSDFKQLNVGGEVLR